MVRVGPSRTVRGRHGFDALRQRAHMRLRRRDDRGCMEGNGFHTPREAETRNPMRFPFMVRRKYGTEKDSGPLDRAGFASFAEVDPVVLVRSRQTWWVGGRT